LLIHIYVVRVRYHAGLGLQPVDDQCCLRAPGGEAALGGLVQERRLTENHFLDIIHDICFKIAHPAIVAGTANNLCGMLEWSLKEFPSAPILGYQLYLSGERLLVVLGKKFANPVGVDVLSC
jgi:hypothetical protein